MSIQPLRTVLAKKPEFYRVYKIRKKNGKYRTISEPIKDIVHWQEKVKEWLDTFPLHDAAHGFRPGRSIVTNAMVHRQQRYVLNIDLKDFFPSVTSYMVYQRLLARFGREQGWANLPPELWDALNETKETEGVTMNQDSAEQITSLCTLNGALPQGACTSPTLANIVASSMDEDLQKLADDHRLRYTRYADDLTFSGDEIPQWLVSRVRKIAGGYGFILNDRKIKKMPYFQRQVVTGVVVNNETLGVSKKRRNQLRQQLYFMGLHGEELDESTLGVLEHIRSINEGQYESLMRSYRGETGPPRDTGQPGDATAD